MRNVFTAVAVLAALAVTATPVCAEGGHGAFTVGYLQVKPDAWPTLSGTDTDVSHLKGINVKYRYELTESVGVMASLSFAASKKSSTTMTGTDMYHHTTLRGRYLGVMTGPSLRVNNWFSAYALAGAAFSRWSDDIRDYRKTEVVPGYVKETTTGGAGDTERHTALAWSAGVQFNPADTVAIDLAYEGSGSGDWRTNAFIVGMGYKF